MPNQTLAWYASRVSSDEEFRAEIRAWLAEHLTGEWEEIRGQGAPGRDHIGYEKRLAWNRLLAEHGWTCVGWPQEYGGRGLSLAQQVIFHEEYARADAPGTVNHLGEQLLGPTLIAFGTDEQKQRFLPPIREVSELWCQGYSEPDAGSDLANVKTRARLDGDEWVIDGQKVWTSHAHTSDWCFVVARTEPGSERHRGLTFLLVRMDQPGVEVRPIEQLTGGSEFNEVFFTGARTAEAHVLGEVGDGWRVAMALLGFERGVSTLGQQVGFAREYDSVLARAQANGAWDDPVLRDRLVRSKVELDVMRANALRILENPDIPGADNIAKLVWATWHRDLGELAMAVAGPESLTASDGDLDDHQLLFLFSRADTIYGGSDEIQRNILAERVLNLPKEPRG